MADLAATRRFVRQALVFEGLLAAVALLAGLFMKSPLWRQINGGAADLAWGLLAAVPLLGAMLLLRLVHSGPLGGLNQAVDRLVVPLFAGCTWSDFAAISLVGGFGEELLFRGVVQALLGHWLGAVPGWVLASVLFGLVHCITPAYAVIAALVGAYLGGLWLWCGNLLAPIVAHAVYDFVALAFLTRRVPTKSEPQTNADDTGKNQIEEER